jgi:hypothetical protein
MWIAAREAEIEAGHKSVVSCQRSVPVRFELGLRVQERAGSPFFMTNV